MLRELGRWTGERTAFPGDIVTIQVDNEKLVRYEIKEKLVITTAKLYEFKNKFGLKKGFAGVVGNED